MTRFSFLGSLATLPAILLTAGKEPELRPIPRWYRCVGKDDWNELVDRVNEITGRVR